MKSWNHFKISNLDWGQLIETKKALQFIIDSYRNSDDAVVKIHFDSDLFFAMFGPELKIRYRTTTDTKKRDKQYEEYKLGGLLISKQIDEQLIHMQPGENNMYIKNSDIESIEILIKLIDCYLQIIEYKTKIINCENEIIILSQLN